jgi:hypothetical protein
MTRQSLLRTTAGAAVTGLVVLAAAPAFAGTPTTSTPPTTSARRPGPLSGRPNAAGPNNQSATLSSIQAAATRAVNDRLATLNKAIADLNAISAKCPVGPLLTTAQNDISGLTALEATIMADTTAQQAKADAEKIFTGYRVYALVIPVDEMVVATCRVSTVVGVMTAFEQKVAGLNDPNVASSLADMEAMSQAAASAVSNLPSQLESYTPADWNANHNLLSGARSSLRTAREDLEKARHDAHQIVQILRRDYGKGRGHVKPMAPPASSTSTASSSTMSSTVPA